MPLCSGRVSTQKPTRLQRHGTLSDSTAPSHQGHEWPLEQRVQGHLEGKATLELTLALKVGGKGQLFVLFKESKRSIYQLMPKIELYLNGVALLENSQLSWNRKHSWECPWGRESSAGPTVLD